MPKPQPYRLPTRFDSATFAKHAIPGEPVVIVKAMGVGSTSPFEFSDRNGRQAIFRFEMKYDGHVLRVPASIWNANKGAMANDLMDQRRLPLPLVVLVELPAATAETSHPVNGLIDAMKADLEYAWSWHCNIAMSAHDSGAGPHSACNKGAALFLSLLSGGTVDTTKHPAYAQTQEIPKSQDGEAVNSPDSYYGIAGSSPAPATTSPETGATVTSDNAPNVVGQGDEPPVAPSSVTLNSDGLATNYVNGDGQHMHMDKPMHEAAFDLLEKPMRFKELAALLETDADTLKSAIQDPISTVELGHAGWVKRREPQA